jgi:hypothetical protein
MTGFFHYEAPRGEDLAGLVDPVDLPLAIRAVVRPNANSIGSLAADIMRSLGATRDLYKAQGSHTRLDAASAWSLARGIADVYLGEVQDMRHDDILDSLDFAQRIGANLHLISGYGQTSVHAQTIEELGGITRPFADLPDQLRTPSLPASPELPGASTEHEIEIPGDDWISYRPTYLSGWPPDRIAVADRVYLDAYCTARRSTASSEQDIARLIADLWQRHGCTPLPATTAARAVQAALFRNGFNVRVSLSHLERFLRLQMVNPLKPPHYQALMSYSDPWRAAATVLHAHHVSTEDTIALRAVDVEPDGSIPSLGTPIDPAARPILAAQRWFQLITGDENPNLIDKEIETIRGGIRRVSKELSLPLVTKWGSLSLDRWQHNYGLKVTSIQ